MMGMTHDDHMHEPLSRGIAFLRQDVGHMRKIREYETREARHLAALERAADALMDGAKDEQITIALQIKGLLDSQGPIG